MTDTDDENIKETRFNLSIFSGFILIGFVVIALFSSLSEDGTSGPASSSLWGYSIILFSLIGIVFVKIKMIEKDENKSVLSYVIGNGLPIFLLLFNILWLISLNVTYFDDINKGLVSKDFYEYSMLNNILDALLYHGSDKKLYQYKNKFYYSEHFGLFDFNKDKLESIVIDANTNRIDEGDDSILMPTSNRKDLKDFEYIFHTHPPEQNKPGGRAIDGILYEFPSISDLYHFIYYHNYGNINGSIVNT